MFLHFKKAFDGLEWNFIKKTLETLNSAFLQYSGSILLQQYSKLRYKWWLSATSFFELERGVRQGCPLSGALFVIAVEILANSIRKDKLITGINFKGREYKLSQYADDTSCLVRDEKSVEKLFEKLQAFRGCCTLDLSQISQKRRHCGLEKLVTTINKPFQHKLAHEVRNLPWRFFLVWFGRFNKGQLWKKVCRSGNCVLTSDPLEI